MITLCISGKATSGKSTAAQVILENFTSNSFAFADEVKRIAYEYGWDGKKDTRGRRLLQRAGDIGREYDSNLWVDRAIKNAKDFAPYPRDAICIFSDCRYPNELDRVKQEMYNVVTMRIERGAVESLQHSSETALDSYGSWDIVIENNGTIEEFKSKIMEAVKCYLKSC